MVKLLSLFLLVAFLFAGSSPGHDLIVNSKGFLAIVPKVSVPQAVNVAFAPTLVVVEANCNSPPVIG